MPSSDPDSLSRAIADRLVMGISKSDDRRRVEEVLGELMLHLRNTADDGLSFSPSCDCVTCAARRLLTKLKELAGGEGVSNNSDS